MRVGTQLDIGNEVTTAETARPSRSYVSVQLLHHSSHEWSAQSSCGSIYSRSNTSRVDNTLRNNSEFRKKGLKGVPLVRTSETLCVLWTSFSAGQW
jgi:hypothetical protein